MVEAESRVGRLGVKGWGTMKAGRKHDVARLLLLVILAAGLTTGPATVVIGQPATETTSSVQNMNSYLSEMTDLADGGEVIQARAMADRFASIYQAEVGDSPLTKSLVEGQIAYVRGDYKAAAAHFDSANTESIAEKSQGRLARLRGSTYVRLGRLPEAITQLERANILYSRFDELNKRGPVLTRLGEAYRRSGRAADARAALDEAKKIETKGGKGLAYLQLALLDYEAGSYNSGAVNGQTAIEILRGPPAKAGLAEAYVIFGRIRFKLFPKMEGEAWRYVDIAREIDSSAPGLQQFIAELPTPLSVPPFETMRPKFAFNREVENGAMTCYQTAPERDGYLANVNVEVQRINTHMQELDRYFERLNGMIGQYNDHGYLEDYQGNVAGRGYRYRLLVLAEHKVIVAKRAAAGGRLEALRTWHGIAAQAAVPCGNASRSRLAHPSYYQPRLPVTDGYF